MSRTSEQASGPASERTGIGRRWRLPLALLVLALLASTAIALLGSPQVPGADLSPSTSTGRGAKALAEVLGDEGVTVREVDRFAEVSERPGRERTLVVVGSGFLTPELTRRLSEHADRVVLVKPSSHTLQDLGIALVAQPGSGRRLEPGCDWPAAVAAGPARMDAETFAATGSVPPGTTLCYPGPGDSPNGAIALVDKAGTTYQLLASASVLRNDSMREPGAAALGLWSLGAHDEVVWWMVDPLDPAMDNDAVLNPLSLRPAWVTRVQWWLVEVGLLAIVWRWRRMGRLVPEPLPVLVRSAETARGRAALYRRAGARDRAAAVLRADAMRRIARRLSLPPSAPAAAVVSATAAACALPAEQVGHVLVGPPPTDDSQLTRLAADLDQLVARVVGGESSLHVPDPSPQRKAVR